MKKADYKYNEIIDKFEINKGDKILLISDLTKFFLLFKKDGKRFDVNKFLDILIESITDEGTLIIPTHNWEFCSSKYFHYHETPSMTGSLGKIALNRKDFKRTKNPIYSFAVTGKDKELLYGLKHYSCFGNDSPFYYFHKNNYKYLSLFLDYKDIGFTPVHYVEEKVGVSYRYFKKFSGIYVNENYLKTNVACSLYVRKLSKVQRTGIKNETDTKLSKINAYKKYLDNDYDFTCINLKPALDLLIDDMKKNDENNRLIYPMKLYNLKRSKLTNFD